MTPQELKDLLSDPRRPLRAIAAALGVSHETARRMRNRNAGMCHLCGKNPPHPKSLSCLDCLKSLRTRSGNKEWKPGSRGRRPIELAS